MFARPTQPREPDLAEQREAIEEVRDKALAAIYLAISYTKEVQGTPDHEASAELDAAIEKLDEAHDAVERACDIAAGILRERKHPLVEGDLATLRALCEEAGLLKEGK